MIYYFAWAKYVNGIQKQYYAVRPDLSIYTSDNWDEFYKETHTYCDKNLSYFIDGYLTSDEDEQIYTHPYYIHPFIIVDGSIRPLWESEITYYDQKDTQDSEAKYFRNNTFNGANLD